MKTWRMLIALAAVLAGCSGGGATCSDGSSSCTTTGSSGGSGSTTTSATVAVSLSSSTVTAAQPATASAKVLDQNSKPLSGVVVSFSVNSSVGSLSQTSALTDATGTATTTLSPASATTVGADTLTASATVSGTAYTGTVGYQLNATTAAIGSFTADSGTAKLAAYGQTLLNLSMTGVSAAAPVSLSVTSNCVSSGKATISPSTVSSSSGTVQFTYKDTGGCGSVSPSDTVTLSVAGAATSASTVVLLTAPTANSVTFGTAVPTKIYLKGSGYAESSTVTFKVVDTAGNALPGQAVTLTLSTYSGSVLLDQKGESDLTSSDVSKHDVQTSDSNGIVTAIVNSGTVPTPIRVIATLPSGVTTVSSSLSVVTGLPSQLNFSLSQQTINIEGGSASSAKHDGVTNVYTIIAADRSGNPVPDGTSIIMWAEGGQVQGSTTTSTVNGTSVATASFVTAEPRPADGRVTVLAYAIGEESFVDTTGTNVWSSTMPSATTNFQDLGDVVKSKLFNGTYDPVNDEYVSLSQTGAAASTSACVDNSATYAQLAVDRSIPSRPNTCDGTWSNKTYVRRAVETVFSSSDPVVLWGQQSTALQARLDGSCKVLPLFTAPQDYSVTANRTSYYQAVDGANWYTAGSATGTVQFIVADNNLVRLNPMPAGTKITAASGTDGLDVSIVRGTPVASTDAATTAAFSYKFTTATAGSFTLSFTTPLGIVNTYTLGVSMLASSTTCQH